MVYHRLTHSFDTLVGPLQILTDCAEPPSGVRLQCLLQPDVRRMQAVSRQEGWRLRPLLATASLVGRTQLGSTAEAVGRCAFGIVGPKIFLLQSLKTSFQCRWFWISMEQTIIQSNSFSDNNGHRQFIQKSSKIIKNHQKSSKIIKNHQFSAPNIPIVSGHRFCRPRQLLDSQSQGDPVPRF